MSVVRRGCQWPSHCGSRPLRRVDKWHHVGDLAPSVYPLRSRLARFVLRRSTAKSSRPRVPRGNTHRAPRWPHPKGPSECYQDIPVGNTQPSVRANIFSSGVSGHTLIATTSVVRKSAMAAELSSPPQGCGADTIRLPEGIVRLFTAQHTGAAPQTKAILRIKCP